MPSVRVLARVADTPSDLAFRRVADFERYPALVDTVQRVSVERGDDPLRLTSDWAVLFRNGLLKWCEDDVLDPESGRITFEQTSGDFDVFGGSWQLTGDESVTVVDFRASFDFGVPSLASIIDPVAVRVLTETIQDTLTGLFPGQVTFEETSSTLDRRASHAGMA